MFTPMEWRRARNISQEKMAELLNVHVNTYRAWEAKPSEIKFAKAIEMASIFNCQLSEINFMP